MANTDAPALHDTTTAKIQAPPFTAQRLVSLDAFRGLIMAAVVFLNYPGFQQPFPPMLKHAPWHGWTVTDLVFPAFVFAMGMSTVVAFAGRRPSAVRVVRRVLLLFALGLLINYLSSPAFPHLELETFRVMGVLQRFALCYLAVIIIVGYARTGWPARLALACAILGAYAWLMLCCNVPSFGAGDLSPEGNLAGYVDRLILTEQHMYHQGPYDPEGLLSTLPAISTTLLGSVFGDVLKSRNSNANKFILFTAGAALLVCLGLAIDPWFPINKRLWSSSFVLFAAGTSVFALLAAWVLADLLKLRTALTPFLALGANPITCYVGSYVVYHFFASWLTVEGLPLREYLYEAYFINMPGAYYPFPLLVTATMIVLLMPLYFKKIYIKA